MTSLPEHLSAASTRQLSAQLDAQFRFLHTFATQALDNASRIAALNLSASRESVERSSHTLRQLIDATGPRDLLVLRTHAEEQVRGLINYGRELFNIGANVQPYGLRTIAPETPAATPALAAPAVVAESAPELAPDLAFELVSEPVAEAVVEAVAEPVAEAAPQAAEVEPAPAVTAAATETIETIVAPIGQPAPVEPVVVQDEAPAARQKPIARAVAKGGSKAAVAPQPMAAPKDSATVTRIDTPPKRRK